MLKWILSGITVVILIVGGIALFYLYNPRTPSLVKQPPSWSLQSITQSQDADNLPVSSSHPALRWANLSYGFQGKIVEVKDSEEGVELVTDIAGKGVPKFIVTDKVQVFFSVKETNAPASSQDLKAGQRVTLSVLYDLKKKVWTVTKVFISLPITPSPRPS